MLASKMLVGIALVAMLVVGVTGSGLLVQAQNATDTNQARAEIALNIARASRGQVIELRDLAASSGLDVSKANEAIEKADTLMAQARELFENEEYTKAWIKAGQAAKTFGVAFRSIVTSIGPNDGFRITHAIQNAQNRIDKLRSILEKIEDATPGTVQQIERHLDEAERLLTEALGLVSTEPRQSIELLKEAQKQIKEATQLLRDLTRDRSDQRIGNLIEQIENRIERVKEAINQLDEQGKDVTEVNAKVVELEAKVAAVKTLVANGEIKQAISDLKEVRELMREILKDIREINSDVIAQRVVKQIEQIENRIERVKEAINKLEEEGTDVIDVSAKVVELEEKLAAVKALVEAGETRDAAQDLEEVRELLQDIQQDIRELQGLDEEDDNGN